MMCPECGFKISSGKTCPNCGCDIEASDVEYTQKKYNTNNSDWEIKPSIVIGVILGIIFVVLAIKHDSTIYAIIASLCFFEPLIWDYENKNSSTTSTPSPPQNSSTSTESVDKELLKRKEEDRKRRLEEEQRIKELRARQLQREEMIRQKELAEQREEQQREEQQREELLRQKEAEERSIELFEEELSNIPIKEFELATEYINNNLVYDMDEIKVTMPRKNSKLSSFGRFTVVDVETTGLKIRSEIIEISAIKFYDFEPIEAFTTLIKPDKPIPYGATEVNGITNDMVENAPTIKQVMPAFIEFVGKDNLLGHNIDFDLKFLYKYGFDFSEYGKRKYFDTLDIARKYLVKLNLFDEYQIDYDVENYKLDTLCEYYDIYRSNAHRSLSDCYATAKVFMRLLSNCDLLRDYDC